MVNLQFVFPSDIAHKKLFPFLRVARVRSALNYKPVKERRNWIKSLHAFRAKKYANIFSGDKSWTICARALRRPIFKGLVAAYLSRATRTETFSRKSVNSNDFSRLFDYLRRELIERQPTPSMVETVLKIAL